MMTLRWGASGLTEVEKNSRRVRGYRETPKPFAALEATVGPKSEDRAEEDA